MSSSAAQPHALWVCSICAHGTLWLMWLF